MRQRIELIWLGVKKKKPDMTPSLQGKLKLFFCSFVYFVAGIKVKGWKKRFGWLERIKHSAAADAFPLQ